MLELLSIIRLLEEKMIIPQGRFRPIMLGDHRTKVLLKCRLNHLCLSFFLCRKISTLSIEVGKHACVSGSKCSISISSLFGFIILFNRQNHIPDL